MDEPVAPRVTSLIVSHNYGNELRRCLEGVENSTGRERLEILVVDDGSRDDTPAILNEFPDVISLRLPKRMGRTRATNIGLRTAKGDLVLLLPPWFVPGPDAIAQLADRVEASADAGAVCCAADRAWPFPTPAQLQHAWRTGELPGARPLTNEGETSVDFPGVIPILTRRGFLRAMNYLDERFGDQWVELELCSRIRDGGKVILVLGSVPMTQLPVAPERSHKTALEWTDEANGVATWIGLHHGMMAGLSARVSMALHALGRGQTSVFTGVLSGAKIDGNQE